MAAILDFKMQFMVHKFFSCPYIYVKLESNKTKTKDRLKRSDNFNYNLFLNIFKYNCVFLIITYMIVYYNRRIRTVQNSNESR